MSRLLLRIGVLLPVAAVVYMAVAEVAFQGPDKAAVRGLLLAGAACLAAGAALRAWGWVIAGLVGRSCPRCGRGVGRGRVYCDEHLKETIDEYRDQQRTQGRRGDVGG